MLCPDTAFHAGLPDAAAVYALPGRWREKWGLRRYGFHGLSYAWALERTAELLGRPAAELDLVLAHLGGGSSVCAVSGGRSVDTSMGFTPLDGVPMSKRSGSVDPGLLLWLLEDGRLTPAELREGLERSSGLLGLSGGRSGDTRDLVAAERDGDEQAALALAVFCHRVSREIAAAATSLGRIDALVFTGEIGWDQPEVREAICRRLRAARRRAARPGRPRRRRPDQRARRRRPGAGRRAARGAPARPRMPGGAVRPGEGVTVTGQLPVGVTGHGAALVKVKVTGLLPSESRLRSCSRRIHGYG